MKSITYKYSCNTPDNISKAVFHKVDKHQIISVFENHPFVEYLEKMQHIALKDSHGHPCPALEFVQARNGEESIIIAITAVGKANDFEFYIFFKYRKTKEEIEKNLQKRNNDYPFHTVLLTEQNNEDVVNVLRAFSANNVEKLHALFSKN